MKKLLIILFFAFLFRVLLIPVARHGDINNNTSWGNLLVSRGPENFYDGKEWEYSAPNQPPLYLYVFSVTSFLNSSTKNIIAGANTKFAIFPSTLVWWWDTWGELYTAKLPAILADLGIGVLIYKFFNKNKKTGLLLCLVWLSNPISWYNSAIWGGTDSIVNLLGLLSIYFLLKNSNLVVSVVFFALSILFKGSLSLLAPVLIFIAFKQKQELKTWIAAIVAVFIVVTVVSFPIHPSLDLHFYLAGLYLERFFPGEIGSLTANAFNFWWLVDSGRTLDSTLFFLLPARILGYIILFVFYILGLYKVRNVNSQNKILLTLSLIPLVSFLFLTRIHERYLYPFFPLATLALSSFRWLWIPYLLFSLINLLNLYHLFWAPGISNLEALYLNPNFMVTLSAISLLVFAYTIIKYQKSVQ